MSQLSTEQLSYLVALRHELHRSPEISGEEKNTAKRVAMELEKLGADKLWHGLGGYGVAAEFGGLEAGPTLLLRCELDGLPIREISKAPHKSLVEGKGHLCGHDGHMASMIGVAMGLEKRPAKGRAILLFQPAEETGAGANAVIADPYWKQIQPDFAVAYHNVPGLPIGEIGLRVGPGNCASRGLKIQLEGKSSHAAAPEDGISPGPAMAKLMTELTALSQGTIEDKDFALVTLTHVELGEATFGIAPANGTIWVTLRSVSDERMEQLTQSALKLIKTHAGDLSVETSWHDIFAAVVNDKEATQIVREVANEQNLPVRDLSTPFRWSEDFGRFGEKDAKASLIYVGAGESHPQLHNPDYDFPDELISTTSGLFLGVVDRMLGKSGA